jgi:2,3-bisphosphoglycerate-independent phosphoglycerate mutase
MKPLVLCILDGVGIRSEEHGNAVRKASTHFLDYLTKTYPKSLLEASGNLVGLPEGQMGNSEVGHMNIGAGRIMYQPLELINKAIREETFDKNVEILNSIKHAKKYKSTLHLVGLLSDGGVHSHINHLFELIDLCAKEKLEKVYIHAILDGRDTLKDSGINFIKKLEDKIIFLDNINIATISGRYYTMDRDNRWDRVKESYEVIVEGNNEIPDYITYIENCYENEVYDEFVKPITIDKEGIIKENDSVLVFNFRPDRLREILKTITDKKFDSFERTYLKNVKVTTMMKVSDEVISTPAFKLEKAKNLFGEVLSNNKLSQLRIAETEKYAHVTYFFDGGDELKLKKAERILIDSPKVATYDLKPEMSAYEITDKLLEELNKNKHDVVILNYANGDMVGHTGKMEETIKAIEVIDECTKKIYEKVKEKGGILLVTADHGNSDFMLDGNDNIITSHSTSKVPFIVTKNDINLVDGKLADIAPTCLELLGVKKPKEMTGNSLIKKEK